MLGVESRQIRKNIKASRGTFSLIRRLIAATEFATFWNSRHSWCYIGRRETVRRTSSNVPVVHSCFLRGVCEPWFFTRHQAYTLQQRLSQDSLTLCSFRMNRYRLVTAWLLSAQRIMSERIKVVNHVRQGARDHFSVPRTIYNASLTYETYFLLTTRNIRIQTRPGELKSTTTKIYENNRALYNNSIVLQRHLYEGWKYDYLFKLAILHG